MVTLRKMTLQEFPAYCDYFIDDYCKEIADNYGHPIDVAITMAKQELTRCFPQGLETQEYDLLCIDADINDESKLVGYLWHAKNTVKHSTFIYDFYIFEVFRGNGFGQQAITELEIQLKIEGITQIKLRDAYHNKRALKLYEKVGFMITGYNMSKNIEG